MSSQREFFYRHLAQTSPYPLGLEILNAEGVYLYSPDGKRYLDLISGIAVSNLGHQHPEIKAAIHAQLDRHMHLMVYGEFVQAPQVQLAARLASLLPETLDSVYFTNSGTEAVEGALKLAKRHTGKTRIVSFRNAYHGSTQGALSVCGHESLKQAYRPLLPEVYFTDYNSSYACSIIDSATAAVIIEPIQGEAGVILPAPGFLEALRHRCNETGTLLIFDEIQSGMGRTGKLFAFEHFNIAPDILLLGKALGGGMPLGAFIASSRVMISLTHHPILGHLTTFGGHPVSCAASLASVDIISNSSFLSKIASQEKLFRELLIHPAIRAIRGKGLFLALEFENPEVNQEVIRNCLAQGLVTDWFLFAPHCLRIAPPLIITDEQIRWSCGIILNALRFI